MIAPPTYIGVRLGALGPKSVIASICMVRPSSKTKCSPGATKRSFTCPISITSPEDSSWFFVSTPLTRSPLALPRSVTRNESPSTMNSACSREIDRWFTHMSRSSARPSFIRGRFSAYSCPGAGGESITRRAGIAVETGAAIIAVTASEPGPIPTAIAAASGMVAVLSVPSTWRASW